MNRLALVLVVICAVILLSLPVLATVPKGISYQGRLTNVAGAPVPDAAYSVKFSIYDAPAAGNSLWTETQSVTTSSGLFSVMLGSVTAFADTLFNDSSRYLGIKVNSDPEMTPRIRLGSVGFSRSSGMWKMTNGGDMYADSSRVGIGFSSPLFPLDVRGSGTSIYASTLSTVTAGTAFRGDVTDFSGSGATGMYGSAIAQSGGISIGGHFIASTTSGTAYGLYGETNSPNGRGIRGYSTSYIGIEGESNTYTGILGLGAINGVEGHAPGAGVKGVSFGGVGVWGEATGKPGVYAKSDANALETEGGVRGVYATGGSYGVVAGGGTYGVYGSSAVGAGMYATGATNGIEAFGTGRGVYASGTNYGVVTWATANGGAGLYATNGSNPATWAGFFHGDVSITGNLQVDGFIFKNGGGFKIDDPTDPANKYLYHSFVESPDMKNIYDGVVTLDANGTASITLPNWFSSVNGDYRYQLTAIGAPGPNLYIAREISGNQFAIAGGTAGMKVSWQVTGIRKDAYASAHRIPVEETKSAEERGTYLHPVEEGVSPTLGLHYAEEQRMAEERKAAEEQKVKLQKELESAKTAADVNAPKK